MHNQIKFNFMFRDDHGAHGNLCVLMQVEKAPMPMKMFQRNNNPFECLSLLLHR